MIEINNISKKYANNIALNNVSFTVKSNSVVGLLGQNGAGKTTLMDIMAGCSKPDSGNVLIHNLSLVEKSEPYKSLIGYVPEIPPLYMDMTVSEYLHFVARLKGIITNDIKAHLAEVIQLAGLKNVEKRLIGNLSKGYRQRVGIAQALIGNAQVLIFDEPTVGLDPKQIHDILNLIKSLSQNRTILISSHRLYEIQEICDQYVILHKGELKHSGSIRQSEHNAVKLELLIDARDMAVADKIQPLQFVKKLRKADTCWGELQLCSLRMDCEKEAFPERALNILLGSNNVTIYGLRRIQEDIEHIFLDVTKE